MSLPHYTATFIHDEFFSDGTTKPLLVKADNGKDYVVKLFSKKNASQRPYTAAEAYAHNLAIQFDLKVPNGAFISIPPELVKLYQKATPELFELLKTKDLARPCFATEYLGILPVFSPALAKKYIEPHDIACIFAFDMFILNEDRKTIKPNLLKAKDNCVLIDHDKAFEGTDYFKSLLKAGALPQYHSNHLFFKPLKKAVKRYGSGSIFDTFEYYLNNVLDLKQLEVIKADLLGFSYELEVCADWEEYLYFVKSNSGLFLNALKRSVI